MLRDAWRGRFNFVVQVGRDGRHLIQEDCSVVHAVDLGPTITVKVVRIPFAQVMRLFFFSNLFFGHAVFQIPLGSLK